MEPLAQLYAFLILCGQIVRPRPGFLFRITEVPDDNPR